MRPVVFSSRDEDFMFEALVVVSGWEVIEGAHRESLRGEGARWENFKGEVSGRRAEFI
jgi:hypothetical protein